VDARSALGWVLGCHPENQIPHFAGDPPSANPLPDLGDHAPVQAKARSMPADHRFRGDHQQYLFLIGPEPPGQDPEELIEDGQFGPAGFDA